MATSASSDWPSSTRAGTESSWPESSKKSSKGDSEVSEWPNSTPSRPESSWSDSQRSVEPGPKKSGKPDSRNMVKPLEKIRSPADVLDILESSLHGGNPDEETNPDVYVRIGSMINAATFVVSQVPVGSLQPGVKIYELLRIECEMRKMFNSKEKKDTLMTEHHFREKQNDPEFTKGTHVAVRRSPRSDYWHRATIREVAFYEDGAHADVFLLDYGDVVTDVSVFHCVRKLPQRLLDGLKPLNFVLQLKEIIPVKMDLDREMGMTIMANVPTSRWSEAATKTVQEYLTASSALTARVSNWVVGKHDGRVYGEVELLDFKEPVFLKHILLVFGFGIRCKGLHLLTEEERRFEKKELKPRFTSIRSNCLLDGSSELPFPEFEDFVPNPNRGNCNITDSTTVETTAERDWTPSANTTLDTTQEASLAVDESSSSLPVWRQARDEEKRTNTESELDLTGSSTVSQQQMRDRITVKNKRRYFYVPGGTDLGKDMEERLKRIPDDDESGVGPKQLPPN